LLQYVFKPIIREPKKGREKRKVEAMWAVFPATPRLCLLPLTPSGLTISANSKPARHRSKPPGNDAVTTKDIKGLGHTILTALNSSHPTNPDPIPEQPKQGKRKQAKQKQEEEGRQISGSDVLWALQRAAAQKKATSGSKKMKKQKGVSSSAGGHREEDGVDYSKARPFCVRSEWGVRLDELEKRLQELSETH
jgi:hypothetical protein